MRIAFILALILLVFGCKKSEDRNCVKSIGTIDAKEIILDDFDKLYMGPHLRYKLVQSTVNKVVINGGANLLNGIDAHVDGGKLLIENKNDCAFLRPYDEIVEVEIHFVNIINIEFEGTNEVLCPDTIQATDLTLLIRDGAGAFDLKIDANSLNLVISHGWGNYNVRGDVNFATFQISSNGFGNSNDLNVSTELIVISNSAGLLEVNSSNCLFQAEINSVGNINYIGIPTILNYNRYGSGDLIDKN